MQSALLNLLSCLFTTGQNNDGLVIIYEANSTPLMVLSFSKLMQIPTVIPQIVSTETSLFWKLECGKYSREETI